MTFLDFSPQQKLILLYRLSEKGVLTLVWQNQATAFDSRFLFVSEKQKPRMDSDQNIYLTNYRRCYITLSIIILRHKINLVLKPGQRDKSMNTPEPKIDIFPITFNFLIYQ
jgi:hypothetical protein